MVMVMMVMMMTVMTMVMMMSRNYKGRSDRDHSHIVFAVWRQSHPLTTSIIANQIKTTLWPFHQSTYWNIDLITEISIPNPHTPALKPTVRHPSNFFSLFPVSFQENLWIWWRHHCNLPSISQISGCNSLLISQSLDTEHRSFDQKLLLCENLKIWCNIYSKVN